MSAVTGLIVPPSFGESLLKDYSKSRAQPRVASFGGLGIYNEDVFKSAVQTPEDYVNFISKGLSLDTPPNSLAFSRLSYIPDPTAETLLAWPGLPPESLQKMAWANIAPQIIINTRVDDVLLYSSLSTQPSAPGWKIEMRDRKKFPSAKDFKEIETAQNFIWNCNTETQLYQARERDQERYTNFAKFLALITRDSLTYDGIAIYTDMDKHKSIKAFTAIPASMIRLAGPEGYKKNKKDFAVLIDEGNNVTRAFSRDELIWYVRNARIDPGAAGYGYSEIDGGVRLLESFQNAYDLNADVFTKNATPNGMLILKGMGFTQNEIDLLSRAWMNMKRGVSKGWTLPALVVPPDGEVDILDMGALKGNEARYQDHLNMSFSLFCALYRIPSRRFGMRISGKGPDAKPIENQADILDDEDPGKVVLLGHIERIVNEYLLWPRWPGLVFSFTGKTPKEDAREYQAKELAKTYGERRASSDFPDLETLAESEDEKFIARIMNLAPTDPGMAGIFQSVVSAYMNAKFGKQSMGEKGDARFPAQSDPGKAEDKGFIGGVRRNSRAERGKL